mgnify:CR=1 FL=1
MNSRIKICFPFIGDSIGGSHLSALLLVESLKNQGIDAKIIVHQRGVFLEELKRQNFDYQVVPIKVPDSNSSRLNTLLLPVLGFWKIVFFLKKEKISLVHTNDMRIHLMWLVASIICGRPVIWHQRTRFGQSRLANSLVRYATTIICISEYVKKSLPANVHKKVSVIPNPVREVFVGDQEKNRYRQLMIGMSNKEKTYVIGSFGSLSEIKRPLVLLETVILMQLEIKDRITLAIFGKDTGDFSTLMKRIVEEKNSKVQIKFFDLTRPIETWMSACDLIVATSEADGFGRSLAEGMRQGVPVLGTDAGGHSEVVINECTGLLAAVNDPVELSKAGLRLLKDHELADRLVENGKLYGKKYFDPVAHANKVTEVYCTHLIKQYSQ